jgi:hypothetical protein
MSGHEQRPGDYRVICDYSGFQCWASETVKTWQGFRVLRRFAGEETQRHPQELVRGKPDHQQVPWARPEPADVFLAVGDVTPGDL